MTPADDLMPFLLAAMNWRDDSQWTVEAAAATPEVAHYVTGWMRSGDAGIVADLAGESVGAAWWRSFTAADPGYGYVADDVPEIGLAVLAGYRGRGIGRSLMRELMRKGRTEGIRGLSISVEDGNMPARRLYESLGFTTVGRTGASDTMLVALD